MAGIITISPGHDASYPWRQIGTSAAHAQPGRAGASYYLAPADKGGEPPGRWYGGGLADLGFRDGQVIERAVFERFAYPGCGKAHPRSESTYVDGCGQICPDCELAMNGPRPDWWDSIDPPF